MDRAQAHRLWQQTLGLGLPRDDEPERTRVLARLRDAGLPPGQCAPVLEALRLPDDLARRTEVVRQTRLCIVAAGHDPDLLSTPAASMRGL